MSSIITILLKVRRRRRRKQNPEDEESSSACTSLWSKQLPEDIMQLILQRLPLSDYLQCSKVCVSWRATVKKAISSQHCHPLPQLPCLMLSSHPFSLNNQWFFSPSDQKFCKPSSPYIDRRNCIGSFEGWLIMSEVECWRPEVPWSTDLLYMQNPPSFASASFFLNPISGDRVMLPSPSTIPLSSNFESFFLTKVVASSAPTSRHCFVAGLGTVYCHLALCRPTDESWTLIKAEEDIGELLFFNIEIIDAKLYAATWKQEPEVSIVVFEIQDVEDANKPLSYRVESLNLLRSRATPERWTADGLHIGDWIHLANDSSSKELFMIFRRSSFALEEDQIISWEKILYCHNFSIPARTEGFRVFKLECNVNGSCDRWVEIEDLGDGILFISYFSNIFIPATNSLNPHNPANSLGRNCIYFASDHLCLSSSSSGRDVGVFSFEDRRVAHFSFSNDPSQTKLFTDPVWFMPNPW